jgi:hypothetical protein
MTMSKQWTVVNTLLVCSPAHLLYKHLRFTSTAKVAMSDAGKPPACISGRDHRRSRSYHRHPVLSRSMAYLVQCSFSGQNSGHGARTLPVVVIGWGPVWSVVAWSVDHALM